MNRSLRQLRKFTVQGPGAEIGRVDRLFVDFERWTIRYIGVLVADSPRRLYLVSPLSLSGVDWPDRRICTRTSRRAMDEGPDIHPDEPISRAQEVAYNRHFRLPRYWDGVGLWGDQLLPFLLLRSRGQVQRKKAVLEGGGDAFEGTVSHLISTTELMLATVEAPDGVVGPVADLLMDEGSWAVRFLVVDTGYALPARKLMVDPAWVERLDRGGSLLYVGLPEAAIRGATEIQEANGWRY